MNKNLKLQNSDKAAKISEKDLKEFGLLMTWAFPLFIGVIAPWLLDKGMQWWTLWVSLFFVTLALLKPKYIYYPYRVWMFLAGIIGWINTRIILGFTFYLLIFPIGIILRLLKKLQYKTIVSQTSNYVKRTDKIEKEKLEQPF